MNVFMSHFNPSIAAENLCDKHVVKMVLECAQLLSTACHELGLDTTGLYKPTHKNHPCTKHCIEDSAYFNWVLYHGFALAAEYTFRYGKHHKSERVLEDIRHSHVEYCLYSRLDARAVPQCMPEFCKVENDPAEAYRLFLCYKYLVLWEPGEARWTRSKPPEWFTNAQRLQQILNQTPATQEPRSTELQLLELHPLLDPQ